jgi:hypothetical protein
MIYNKELTDELVECFGEEVFNWSKSTIRYNLEMAVEAAKRLILNCHPSARDAIHKIYNEIKEVDDQFTELYINEIDEIEI